MKKDYLTMTIKKCELCGDEFESLRKTQKYCKKEHMNTCVICGKEFKIKKLAYPAVTCSSHCASIKSHTEESKEKRRINSLEKYGTEFPLQAKEIKEKIQESLDNSENDLRFGSKKFKKLIKDKYNVTNVSQLNFVKEKKKQTILKHYGVENPMQSEKLRQRQNESFKRNNKVERPSELNVKHIEEWRNLERFVKEHNMNIYELAKYFNVNKEKMVRECRRQKMIHNIYQYGEFNSLGEQEIVNFLAKEHPEVEYIRNDRKTLNGKELDFYFPKEKLAVEISPTSTHNAIRGFASSEGKSINYHKEKFLACAKLGIELITVFDWHDYSKIEEMLSSKLNKGSTVVYARKLKYKEFDKLEKDLFQKLSDWHILSLPNNFKRNNKVGALLDENNEIIGLSLWTDTKDYNTKELKRLVFKPGWRVMGGASKLVKNFNKNNPTITKITTYSDCDLGTGSVYEKIGFTLIEESKPSLNYYNIRHQQHIKNLSLVKQGADRLLANFPNYEKVGIGENLPSNQEIIESYGFLPVYDCGYRKWELIVNLI